MNSRINTDPTTGEEPGPRPNPNNAGRVLSNSDQTLGVRDLRTNVAASLRRAQDGERIIVTVDGRPVAQLGPISPIGGGVTMWDLAGAGLIEPPRRHDRPSTPPPMPVPADVRADRLLDSVRGRR